MQFPRINTIKHIDQAALSRILSERVNNREAFADAPLILWRSYIFDGIQWDVLRDVFAEFNADKDNDSRMSFFCNPRNGRKERLGLCIIDATTDYSDTLRRFRGIPTVVYAPYKELSEKIISDFPNAEHRVFLPDFEQWCQLDYVKTNFTSLVKFIRESNDAGNLSYRWYNRFGDIPGGCDFPSCWIKGISKLRFLKYALKKESIGDFPEEEIRKAFQGGITSDLVEEFIRYVKTNQLTK